MITYFKTLLVIFFLLYPYKNYSANSNSEEKFFIEAGKELYKKRCSNCHGGNAQGKNNGFFLSPNLRVFDKGYKKFLVILKNGYGRMPAWGGTSKLTENQLNQLASYIKHISLEKASWE